MSDAKRIEVKARGVAPILFHNGQLARPHGAFSSAMKDITGKRNKSEADHVELARIEWRGGWWTTVAIPPHGAIPKAAKPTVPLEAIDSMLVAAGSASMKSGKKLVQAAVMCLEAEIIMPKGEPQTIAEMEGVEQYMDQRMARVQKGRVLRSRPRLDRWSLRYVIQVTDAISVDQIERLAEKAGDIGAGDWRPRYGRHQVDSVEVI